MLASVRRIVTGVDAQGRSCIVADGPSPAEMTLPGRVDYRNANLWRTVGSPCAVDAPDSILEHRGVAPPPGGTVFRIIDIPPEDPDPEVQRKAVEAVFRALYPDADHDAANARAAGMHTTDSVDYAIVLEGELVAVLDADEALMKAGDVLIQRGTRHAWSNRSGKVARIAFILVDGQR
jgi:hypothetical protein